jgi:hypothetical protein
LGLQQGSAQQQREYGKDRRSTSDLECHGFLISFIPEARLTVNPRRSSFPPALHLAIHPAPHTSVARQLTRTQVSAGQAPLVIFQFESASPGVPF